MELLVASNCLAKARQIKSILKATKLCDALDIFLEEIPFKSPIVNSHTLSSFVKEYSFELAAKENCAVLLEASGLFIPAFTQLKQEGLHEFFTPPHPFLKELLSFIKQNSSELPRQAFFESWITFATPKKLELTVSSSCEGCVIDPSYENFSSLETLFVKHGYDKPLASLQDHIKNKISHRSKAVDKLLPMLEKKLS
jgi:XTP/dITP diphosphohydrolase